jgi:hypothetical protein
MLCFYPVSLGRRDWKRNRYDPRHRSFGAISPTQYPRIYWTHITLLRLADANLYACIFMLS